MRAPASASSVRSLLWVYSIFLKQGFRIRPGVPTTADSTGREADGRITTFFRGGAGTHFCLPAVCVAVSRRFNAKSGGRACQVRDSVFLDRNRPCCPLILTGSCTLCHTQHRRAGWQRGPCVAVRHPTTSAQVGQTGGLAAAPGQPEQGARNREARLPLRTSAGLPGPGYPHPEAAREGVKSRPSPGRRPREARRPALPPRTGPGAATRPRAQRPPDERARLPPRRRCPAPALRGRQPRRPVTFAPPQHTLHAPAPSRCLGSEGHGARALRP